jgi:hypothetical protein
VEGKGSNVTTLYSLERINRVEKYVSLQMGGAVCTHTPANAGAVMARGIEWDAYWECIPPWVGWLGGRREELGV